MYGQAFLAMVRDIFVYFKSTTKMCLAGAWGGLEENLADL